MIVLLLIKCEDKYYISKKKHKKNLISRTLREIKILGKKELLL